MAGPVAELICIEKHLQLPVGAPWQVTLQRLWQERLRQAEGRDFELVVRRVRSRLTAPHRFALDLALSLVWAQASRLLREPVGRQRLEKLSDRLLQAAELSGPEVRALLNSTPEERALAK